METARSGKCEDNIEGGSMKHMFVILSFVLLLTGCYTNSTVTKESPQIPDNEELTFYLTDGTSIKSKSEEHHRVENGYRVRGKLVNTNQWWNVTEDFDGIARDEQIKDITIKEINSPLTIIFVAGIVGGIAYVIISNTHSSGFNFGWDALLGK
jgi:hypothetical protein